ncbi:MAG: cobyrinate a,c-diamide synthase [Proteobacteria bacterium]|nr:cobyrinate a,c-diamide synthase [Pseudomonadota bacterium]MBU4294304.1 cobyrinate a,c-diamide synthase [Pseudomonadota bacterium]MCG2746117.1 cobyrinate a,c-diamide synthase [Desulfobulbaceae bacterium]
MKNKKGLPRGLVIAGLGGGSGKSVVSVGLVALLRRMGHTVVPFKKGPDYIDAGWLSLAAGRPCFNLDPYLMDEDGMLASFAEHAADNDFVIVEGNRGLYDGVDASGTYSTAELACRLGLPVLLVVDCTKTTRTVAALVLGCKVLDPNVNIAGVVLNRIGSSRHEKIVREAVEKYTGIPVVGAIRRMKRDIFPMRHLGVTPFQEYDGSDEALQLLAETIDKSVSLADVEPLMATPVMAPRQQNSGNCGGKAVRIGVIRDAAFQFYYPENLLALERCGAELVAINSMVAEELPDIDALYIGGGFPETSARLLADNVSFRQSIRQQAALGLPIYAECGGLIYLGEKITLDGEDYPLVGLFPVHFTLEKKPQAHGYSILEARPGNPFYEPGVQIKGHEFRYSKVAAWPGRADALGFDMKRGVGFIDGRDGLIHKNVLALYTHVHAIGTPQWAPALAAKAREFAGSRGKLCSQD